MKKTALLLCVLLTFFLAGCNSGSSVAIVDIQKVFADSENGRKSKEYAATVQQVLQQNLNVIQEKVQSYPDKKQVEEILQAALQQLQADLKRHHDDITRNSLTSMHTVIKEYQAEAKFDIILNKANVIEHSDAVNITPEIITRFDKLQILFPALPKVVTDPVLPAPRALPEPEAPAEPEIVGADEKKDETKR